MSNFRYHLMAFGLTLAAANASADTVYTFAYSTNYDYDTRFVSSTIQSIDTDNRSADHNNLLNRWRDALKSEGYGPSQIASNFLAGAQNGYYKSHEEAESKRRAMLNEQDGKRLKIIGW